MNEKQTVVEKKQNNNNKDDRNIYIGPSQFQPLPKYIFLFQKQKPKKNVSKKTKIFLPIGIFM